MKIRIVLLAMMTCLGVGQLYAQPSLKSPVRLLVGDNAPEFTIEKWLKGGGYAQLSKGKIYVIDLWATWCVPCIASMPHLSKLQEKYKDKEVTIIGITSEDKYGNSVPKIEAFVQKRDSILRYDMALVPASTNKDGLQGIFVHPWMQQIGTMNLPTAFIIDRNGKIAYIGDPHTIDQPLAAIVNQQYNLTTLRSAYLEGLQAAAALDTFSTALKANQLPQAIRLGQKILQFESAKPTIYLSLADQITKMKGSRPAQLLALAVAAAKRGVILTQFESPGFLSALAAVYASEGDYVQAAITIKTAIDLSEGDMKEAQIQEMNKYLSLIATK